MRAPKTRCNGMWTEARFMGFIKSALRSASSRWAPKYQCLKNARIGRNLYKCADCGGTFGNKGIKADHTEPVVDIQRGFTGWDEYIRRLFVEVEGFQALCIVCHAKKTLSENVERTNIRARAAQ